jgi:hypothetical protein
MTATVSGTTLTFAVPGTVKAADVKGVAVVIAS